MKYDSYRKFYDYNKKQVIPMLRAAGLDSEAAKVESCGSFFKGYRCKHCDSVHFQGFNRCKSKYCSLCNYTKYLICFRRLYDFFRNWINSGHYCCLLTLTVKDGDSLHERLNVLNSCWRYLTANDPYMASFFKSRFAGGFKSLEVKLGKHSEAWHPHLHVLALKYDPSRDIESIRLFWELLISRFDSSTYIPQVDIRSVKYRPGYSYNANDRDPLVGAC